MNILLHTMLRASCASYRYTHRVYRNISLYIFVFDNDYFHHIRVSEILEVLRCKTTRCCRLICIIWFYLWLFILLQWADICDEYVDVASGDRNMSVASGLQEHNVQNCCIEKKERRCCTYKKACVVFALHLREDPRITFVSVWFAYSGHVQERRPCRANGRTCKYVYAMKPIEKNTPPNY